jgi:hypothetical protein
LINLAKARGMNLVFSATSALGEGPVNGRYLGHDARSHRVLDPLLWALELERREPPRCLKLVLDASPSGAALYRDLPIAELWERLCGHGEVTTYFLGQARPAALAAQRPPASPPPRTRQALIGSILESCGDRDRLIVITSGRVIDLRDFRGWPGKDRLLVVHGGAEPEPEWDQFFTYRAGDGLEPLIDAVLQL